MGKLLKLEAVQIRFETSRILHSTKPPSSNIMRKENFILKNLQLNSKIDIIPADKGNNTIILDFSKYSFKLNTLLEGDLYSLFTKDPTSKIELQITSQESKSYKEVLFLKTQFLLIYMDC